MALRTHFQESYSLEEAKTILSFELYLEWSCEKQREIKTELDNLTAISLLHHALCRDPECEKRKGKENIEGFLKRRLNSQNQFRADIAYCMATLSAQSLEEKIQKEEEEEEEKKD